MAPRRPLKAQTAQTPRKPAAAQTRAPKPEPRPTGPAPIGLIADTVAGKTIAPEAVADVLGITKGQLATMVGLPTDALYRAERASAVKTQNRMREMIEVLMRIEPWAGGRLQALAWYRGQSIAALGDQTAEALVREGKADIVRAYLDGIAVGGYA